MDPASPAADTRAAVTLDELLDLLDLSCVGEPTGRVSHWIGQPQQHPAGRLFGGLLLAQALVAAGRGIRTDQRIISLQADFVGGVPTDRPLHWEVTVVSDAPSLATRRSRLLDDTGEELFGAVTRWATVRDDLPSYSSARRAPAPDPETLPDHADRFGSDERIPPWWRLRRPIHFRHAVAPPYVTLAEPNDRQTTFFRATGPLPDDAVLRAALVAYVSDMSILEASFLALGSARHKPGARILSLTHALTFHAAADLTEWHQFDCRVESIAHGRAHGVGELFDAAGRHVATASQVGLVKTPTADRE
ncbi:acyl-CoA thioesterase II [Nocardioides sp. YR527]|uniref:acyl-CoA thioesterase n=1 Tax=Nocardioides sp. YR527 TaxID=1881028 RepID=UPI001C40A0BE|nr:acyl-CoA thioesterase domain-containing protein [Nocardioides sp. YR527]